MKLAMHIKSFELDNKLFEDSIFSKVWKSVRTQVYYNLQKDRNIFSDVKPSFRTLGKIRTTFKVLHNSIFHRPSLSENIRYLIVQHPRTINENGEMIDPYSHHYTSSMKDNALYLSRSSFGEKSKSLSNQHASLDMLSLLPYLKFKRFSKFELNYINKLVFKLCDPLDISPKKYVKLFKEEYRKFKIEEEFFLNMLDGSNIEKVYLVDHYSKNVPLISACKFKNIPVLEFQHGIISDYHLGYSVSQPQLNWPCYPDTLISWGEHWLNGATLPDSISITKISPPYLKKVNNIAKKNYLLVVSQAVIGKKLASLLLDHVKVNCFERVVFKLHPSEIDLLPFYLDFFSESKVEVSVDDIYEWLNVSQFVLGVFSTVMLEALDFGCEVYYSDLPGSEYLESNSFLRKIEKSDYYA